MMKLLKKKWSKISDMKNLYINVQYETEENDFFFIKIIS